jgi:hypothetical protein
VEKENKPKWWRNRHEKKSKHLLLKYLLKYFPYWGFQAIPSILFKVKFNEACAEGRETTVRMQVSWILFSPHLFDALKYCNAGSMQYVILIFTFKNFKLKIVDFVTINF